MSEAKRALQDAVTNAEETLADALDDTSVLSRDHYELEVLRADVARAKKALADLEAWSGCCRAAGRLADLVCLMYHPKDELARKVWPTATWAEIIASELGIEVPETT